MSSNALRNVIDLSRQRAERLREMLRPYLPALVQRLALTYGLPMLAAVLLATLGAVAISNVLPNSTTTLVVLGLNIAVLYFGWRFAERRYRGTGLFMLYSAYSRERRELEMLIRRAEKGLLSEPDVLTMKRQMADDAARAFLDAMRAEGVQPPER